MSDSVMRTYAISGVLLLLAACSGGEPSRVGELVAPAQASTDFGDLRVHYNALPTMSMSEAVAQKYGVAKDPGTAMVFVGMRRVVEGNEFNAEGDVAGRVFDLQGKRQPIVFSAVDIGEYTDHIGIVEVGARDSYRFEVGAKVDGRSHIVKFQRNF